MSGSRTTLTEPSLRNFTAELLGIGDHECLRTLSLNWLRQTILSVFLSLSLSELKARNLAREARFQLIRPTSHSHVVCTIKHSSQSRSHHHSTTLCQTKSKLPLKEIGISIRAIPRNPLWQRKSCPRHAL